MASGGLVYRQAREQNYNGFYIYVPEYKGLLLTNIYVFKLEITFFLRGIKFELVTTLSHDQI